MTEKPYGYRAVTTFKASSFDYEVNESKIKASSFDYEG
jgi:hypothetical protein